MKFLKQSNPEPEEENKKEIVVRKLVTLNIQCLYCDEWAMMEGGPTEKEEAKFICPNCNKVNTVKWNIDI